MVPKCSEESKAWRKLVSVTWVVGQDSTTFLGCVLNFNFFDESAAECEYAANFSYHRVCVCVFTR